MNLPYYRQQPQVSQGYQDMQIFLSNLLKAASNEAQAIDFYTRVLDIAPNEKARENFSHALNDERVHYRIFTDLYTRLTQQEPQVPSFTPVQFNNFSAAVERAVGDELEAYEMYRNMYLSTYDPVARDILLRGFTDEMEHAVRFTNLRFLM